MRRQDALAAAWAAAYSTLLVLTFGLAARLGISPYYTVPFVVVILPFAVGLMLLPFNDGNRRTGT